MSTNLYQDGTELELVSRILGRSSTGTTRIYAVPSVEMMRKAMETGIPFFLHQPQTDKLLLRHSNIIWYCSFGFSWQHTK